MPSAGVADLKERGKRVARSNSDRINADKYAVFLSLLRFFIVLEKPLPIDIK